MRAMTFDEFGGPINETDIPIPDVPDHAALIRVTATGVCRSDHHAWLGHDSSVNLPHVPGHEFAGVVDRVGAGVSGWSGDERVTAPFVNACGTCRPCQEHNPTVCVNQTQPGFDRPGTWAEFVVVDHADVNLVALPDALDDVTSAALGCRFATSYRGVVTLGAAQPGEQVVVLGCGGVGLAAVMIAAERGAHVVAVDPSEQARTLAVELGASETVEPGRRLVAELVDLTDGGAHVTVEALGRAEVLHQAIAALRPRGRHVQIGLLLGEDANPPVDMGRVIGQELQILGSHGMGAQDYPAMLADIANGRLDPSRLVGRTRPLPEAEIALAAMGSAAATQAGTTVLIP